MLAAPYHHVYYVASGNNATFSYSFQGLNILFVKCSVKHTDGTIDYNAPVRVNTNPDGSLTGTITFEENIPEQGAIVLIERDTPKEQDTAYGQSITFNSDNIEASFDQVVAMLQEVSDQVHNHSLMLNLFQDEPFTLDFIKEEDDGASVVIDYEGKLLKKGLYFRLNGNLEVSVNGQTYIKMPKSADILEFRQVITEDNYYVLQYRVGDTWYGINLDAIASQAAEAAQKADQAQKTADGALAVTYQLEASKADKVNVYNKQEADEKFAEKAEVDVLENLHHVRDVVKTRADLNAYPIEENHIVEGDLIIVLKSESSTDAEHNAGESVLYKWHNNNWQYYGALSYRAIQDIRTRIDKIEKVIPDAASATNQLADKAFVNSSVQTATTNFRGSWATWADVPTSADEYPVDYAGNKTPTVNDYLVVADASGFPNQTLVGTWRFKYSGTWATDGKNGWLPEYQVNEEPLTMAQLAALNSGVSAELLDDMQADIDRIDGKTAELDGDLQGKVDKDQGVENAGKFLKVGEDGNVELGDSSPITITYWE